MFNECCRYERIAWIPILITFLVVAGLGGKHLINPEERECQDNYVPEVSALDTSATGLELDPDTVVHLSPLIY